MTGTCSPPREIYFGGTGGAGLGAGFFLVGDLYSDFFLSPKDCTWLESSPNCAITWSLAPRIPLWKSHSAAVASSRAALSLFLRFDIAFGHHGVRQRLDGGDIELGLGRLVGRHVLEGCESVAVCLENRGSNSSGFVFCHVTSFFLSEHG